MMEVVVVRPSSPAAAGQQTVGEPDHAAGIGDDRPDDRSGGLETGMIGCGDDLADGLSETTPARALGVNLPTRSTTTIIGVL